MRNESFLQLHFGAQRAHFRSDVFHGLLRLQ
jgi:hypothetical protein